MKTLTLILLALTIGCSQPVTTRKSGGRFSGMEGLEARKAKARAFLEQRDQVKKEQK